MFKRGLDSEFVAALNEAYKRENWWKTIIDDTDLHLGIRKNYLNIYYAGNSLINLKYKSGQLEGKTHYKFLLNPFQNLYIQSSDGKLNFNDNVKTVFIKHFNDLNAIKKASFDYAGEEKKGIQKILMSNPNIIDVEIALKDEVAKEEVEGLPAVESKRATAPRIDFAALQKCEKGWELAFFEAKIFANSSLRASEGSEPKVVHQLMTYNKLIEQQMAHIKDSYRHICKNLSKLEGISQEQRKIVQGVAQGDDLIVSPRPRLVIFGYDRDQEKGKLTQNLQRLRELLKENPVYSKGNPMGFIRGISTCV